MGNDGVEPHRGQATQWLVLLLTKDWVLFPTEARTFCVSQDARRMLRWGTRSVSGYGLCLEDPQRVGEPISVGCEVAVEDFATQADGQVILKVRGGRRFNVLETVQATDADGNALRLVEVTWRASEAPDLTAHSEIQALRTLVHGWYENSGQPGDLTPQPTEDLEWLSWQLGCNSRGIAVDDLRRLLEEDQAVKRLGHYLHGYVQKYFESLPAEDIASA